MQQKKIEAYLDCVSPYSFYAFSYLRQNQQALKASGVEVEFIPVFLGGINVASGNKPPWTLPAKAVYARYDGQRAQKYFGMKFEIPTFFPSYHFCFFKALWLQHRDISKPKVARTALLEVFSEEQAAEILRLAETPEIKQALNDVTLRVVKDFGAFGCPWSWVHDGKGNAEPFFGSDRFHFMWDYLEVPHRDLELHGPATGKL
ncbi:putative DSBA family oxidoreductase [Bisporella sp. PMI_857]|nr:putative DSBA family oxidoreductase [Bisporella sp. PMI_857]